MLIFLFSVSSKILAIDEGEVTQTLAAPDHFFQTMDPTVTLTHDQRPPEQQVPFNRVSLRLQSPVAPLQLGGFAVMILITREYGLLIQLLRQAGTKNFLPEFLDNSMELEEISNSISRIRRCGEPWLMDLNLIKSGLPKEEYVAFHILNSFVSIFLQLFQLCRYYCALMYGVFNLIELLICAPALSSMDVLHANLIRPHLFKKGLDHATDIFRLVNKLRAHNPSLKGMLLPHVNFKISP
jgi:hypothetical protein